MKIPAHKFWAGAVAALLITALVFALAGCKKADNDTPDADANPALANVIKGDGKTLTIASDATFAPMEFMNDAGEMTGFDVDLMKAVAEELGAEIEFKNMEWDALVTGVSTNAGQFDAAASSMTITPEREENILFSDPYFVAVQALAVPQGSTLKSADELKSGDKVAVQNATTGHIWVQANLESKGIVIKPYSGGQECFTAMAAGEVNAVIIDSPVAAAYTQQESYKSDLIGPIEGADTENYGIALPKGADDLCKAINEALKKIIEDGRYAELYKQYIDDKNDPVIPQ
jgi:polar amino acid transport system substrate-binding protein